MEGSEERICPGSGGTWVGGMSVKPVCPVCHIGPGGMGVRSPRLLRHPRVHYAGLVPTHLRRRS
jgi:hypothetical protein